MRRTLLDEILSRHQKREMEIGVNSFDLKKDKMDKTPNMAKPYFSLLCLLKQLLFTSIHKTLLHILKLCFFLSRKHRIEDKGVESRMSDDRNSI